MEDLDVCADCIEDLPRIVSACRGCALPLESDIIELCGACQRTRAARVALPECSHWVGLEGGIEEGEHGMAAFAWAVVLSGGRIGRARSGTFYLPPPVAALVREGHELGEADDIVFGRTGSKQEEGAIGLLTLGAIDRAGLYAHAVTLALVPFLHPELYPEHYPGPDAAE